MAFVVETGAGSRVANALTTPAFVTAYLTDRGRVTENGWQTTPLLLQQQCIVRATDYIRARFGPLLAGRMAYPWLQGLGALGRFTLTANPTGAPTDVVVIGSYSYRFVVALATGQPANFVLVGATLADSIANLANAINSGYGGFVAVASSSTLRHTDVTAVAMPTTLELASAALGSIANSIALKTTIVGATASGATLTGGVDEGPQALPFPRRGVFIQCIEALGVPLQVQQAVAEYAVRARGASLLADPTAASAGNVTYKREKIGPIEEETRYSGSGATTSTIKEYPAADRLMSPFLLFGGAGGRTIRA